MAAAFRVGFRLAAAALLAGAVPAQGGDPAWSITLRTEPSAVEIGPRTLTWWTHQVLLERREPGLGGEFLSLESQTRDNHANGLITAGWFRAWPDWILSLQGAGGVDPAFLPRASGLLEVQRRLFGKTFLLGGYQALDFPDARVHLASGGLVHYFPSGEFEVRWKGGRNETADHEIRLLSARLLVDAGGRWGVGGSAARGRNLFDVLAVPVDGGDGWTANLNLTCRATARSSFRLDLGVGREAPAFRQRTLGLGYRRLF